MKTWLHVLWIVGLCVFLLLIVAYGVEDVLLAVAGVGWRLGIVCLLHLVPLVLHTVGWAVLLPRRFTRPFLDFLVFRWYGESAATVLPVTPVGGDLLRGYLHQRTGVPSPIAIGAAIIDLTTEVAAQLAFAALALAALLSRQHDKGTALPLIAALSLLSVLVYGFYLAQRRGLFGRAVRLFEGLVGIGAPTGSAYAQALDRAVRRLYRRQRHVRLSVAFHFLGWLAGVLQVYAAAAFLGHPIGWLDALILEGLITAVRAAAFMIPGALGVQEGAFIVLGGLVGLPPEVALSLSLIRRVRELLLGLSGTFMWQRSAIVRGALALVRRPPAM